MWWTDIFRERYLWKRLLGFDCAAALCFPMRHSSLAWFGFADSRHQPETPSIRQVFIRISLLVTTDSFSGLKQTLKQTKWSNRLRMDHLSYMNVTELVHSPTRSIKDDWHIWAKWLRNFRPAGCDFHFSANRQKPIELESTKPNVRRRGVGWVALGVNDIGVARLNSRESVLRVPSSCWLGLGVASVA